MLELFMGHHPGEFLSSLSSTARKSVLLKHMLDTRLPIPEAAVPRQIFEVIMVAVRCIEANPLLRPAMQDAIKVLSMNGGPSDLDYLHTEIVIPACWL